MREKCTILTLCFFVSLSSVAQLDHLSGIWGSHLARANQLFNEQLYEESIVYYKKELERSDYNEEAVAKAAEAYMILGKYQEADMYYTLLFAANRELDNQEYLYNYASALISTGRYDKAKIWMEKYLQIVPGDTYAKNKLSNLSNMDVFYADSNRFALSSLGFNSEKTEMGAVIFGDGILFSSGRDEDLIIDHDNLRESESLLDLYYYNYSDSSVALKKLPHHWKSNDGPSSVVNGDFVTTRNNGYDSDLEKNTLGLYFVKSENGDLHISKHFEHNSPSYSLMHPALNDQGDTLFFSSDMPGGMGGKDLYYSVLIGEEWSAPMNMGSGINTPKDEVFPFNSHGVLYFSSNGYPGLGGLDIYKKEGKEIVNVGFPLNTGYDDFSFYISNNKGFITSNRPSGMGHDDIYGFTYSPPVKLPPAVVSILVIDSLNRKPIQTPDIVFVNKSDSTPVYSTRMKGTGYFEYQVERMNYVIDVESSGYQSTSVQIDMMGSDKKTYEIPLMPDIDLEIMNLDSILFDYDDHVLTKSAEAELTHIIELMNSYSNLNLEVSAHTDARGEEEYNLLLSQKRANATAEYLSHNGIDPGRIITHGYGEAHLLNQCDDDADCTEEDHMINRRIEFRLTVAED